jgi:hypothetical protein
VTKFSRNLLLLHLVAALLWLGAFFVSNRSCPAGSCGEAGIILIPLFIPPFIATVAAVVFDITHLSKRIAPAKYGPMISWLIPTLLVGMPVLWLIIASFYSFQKDHYSTQKAVSFIENCEASALGGYGANTYIYLKNDPTRPIKVTGGEAAPLALTEAATNSAGTCGYDLNRFDPPVN